MASDIVVVVGDTPIRAIAESGLPLRAGPGERHWLFVTSEGRTAQELDELARRRPGHVSIVELRRPEAAGAPGWNDPAAIGPEQRAFRFEDRLRYQSGSIHGAQTRADAALRAIMSDRLEAAVEASVGAVLHPALDGEHLPVQVTVVLNLTRNTGSGAGVAVLGVIERVLARWRQHADFRVDVVAAAPSLVLSQPARSQALFSRACFYAELRVAEDRGVPVAVRTRLDGGWLGHVIEVGAPGRQNGLLRDEVEARRSLALVVEALIDGGVADELRALTPLTTPLTAELRPATGERTRFSGIGVAEVRLEPAEARRHFAAHVMAHLPPPELGIGPA
jgi:hypothetical protein